MTSIPVFLASDNNYAPYVASTIASICDNTSSFIDFYVLDGGITKENQNKISKLKEKFENFSLEFLEIDMDKEFSSIKYSNKGDYISLSTYNRFLIPQLKPEIDLALYSDVDVIVLGDISEMYYEGLNGFALGAISEEYLEKTRNLERKERLGLNSNHKYFSAGNLIIDCKKWRDEKILDKLFESEYKYRDLLEQADMDVLNLTFNGNNYQELNAKYCLLDAHYDFYDGIMPLIRHYHGDIKPWHISPDKNIEKFMPNHKDFWRYLALTEFYDEVCDKTTNDLEQNKIIRRLQVIKIMRDQHAKNNR
jgi:lipopolysaccharide biosynthesis glycosyltransferase